ncbi:MAG: hypothetical protein NVS2B4_06570 [Ramlibacter sp.]
MNHVQAWFATAAGAALARMQPATDPLPPDDVPVTVHLESGQARFCIVQDAPFA